MVEFSTSAQYSIELRCPSHPSVFASCDGTGSLNLWDMTRDTEVPLVRTAVSSRALNKLKWSGDGSKIATGDADGNVFVFTIGQHIHEPGKDAWQKLEETMSRLVSV